MAGGIYDSRNFEQKQLKMTLSKNILFTLNLFLIKCIRIYLVKGFYKKYAVLGDFSIKK
jgi:hypothetical protein